MSGLWGLPIAAGKLYFSALGRDITTALNVLGQQQVMETEEGITNRTLHHSGESGVIYIITWKKSLRYHYLVMSFKLTH